MTVIPYGRQTIEFDDIDAVLKTLSTDWLTQGPRVKEFEEALAQYCGARYAVAVSSGTAALHLAVLALDLKKNWDAITTPISFVATSNSVLYVQGKVVFADIEPATVNIDPGQIAKKIRPSTKVILPVHFGGLPCRMPEIYTIALRQKIKIIEDGSHALGARYHYKGEWVKVGSCRHSDMTVFSFHPVKTMTLGEGGAIATNDPELYKKLLALRTHGIYRDEKTQKIGPWFYEMRELGFNYRVTDFQCALGLSQLKKLDRFIEERREIAAQYQEAFKDLPYFQAAQTNCEFESAHHLFAVRINFKKLKTTRQKFISALAEFHGVGSQVHYIPIYCQPYYRRLGFKKGLCPNAERYYEETLSLPLFPSMTESQVQTVINGIKALVH